MNNIWNLIGYLVSPRGLASDILWRVNRFHLKIFLGMPLFIIPLFIQTKFSANGFGLYGIFIAAVVTYLMYFYASRPKTVAEIAGIGALLPEGKKAVQGLKDLEKLYFSVILKISLWYNLTSIVIAVIPVGRFQFGVILVLYGMFILALMAVDWNMEVKYAKKVAFFFVALVVVGCFLMLLPPVILNKIPGGNWLKSWIPNPVEVKLDELKTARNEEIQKRDIEFLNRVWADYIDGGVDGLHYEQDKTRMRNLEKKIADGQPLTVLGNNVNEVINNINKQRRDRIATATNPYGNLSPYEVARTKFEKSRGVKLIAKTLNDSNEVEILEDPKLGDTIYVFSKYNFLMVNNSRSITGLASTQDPNEISYYYSKNIDGPLRFKKLNHNVKIYYYVKKST